MARFLLLGLGARHAKCRLPRHSSERNSQVNFSGQYLVMSVNAVLNAIRKSVVVQSENAIASIVRTRPTKTL
jgi:hypothetical protein